MKIMTQGTNSNFSSSILSVSSPFLFDKGAKKNSLEDILLLDLSIFLDFVSGTADINFDSL